VERTTSTEAALLAPGNLDKNNSGTHAEQFDELLRGADEESKHLARRTIRAEC
jgi:hypothetical protein